MSTWWSICLAVFDRACMLESQNRARCSINHLVSDLITYALRWSHQSVRSNAFHIKNLIKNCSYERRSLYNFIRFTIFSYWFQNAFHIEVLDQKLFHASDVFFYKTWWHVKQLHAKFSTSSVCQCERDISKVTNFCLTIAHEICDNELIKSSMSLKSSMFIILQIREYVSVAVIFRLDWRIRALSILLYYTHRRSCLMHNREQKQNHSKN